MKSPIESASNNPRKVLVSPIVKSRGRVFLELVKQNKLNVSPQLSNKFKQKLIKCEEVAVINEKKDGHGDVFLPNVHFDPNSSPSSGILSKRKQIQANTPDSPTNASAKVLKTFYLHKSLR
jgi:hypothetical protein